MLGTRTGLYAAAADPVTANSGVIGAAVHAFCRQGRPKLRRIVASSE